MIIKGYTTSRGELPVKEFIDALQRKERQEILKTLELIRSFGKDAPGVSMRQIRGKLWEIRIGRSRIFYVLVESDTMVLLSAYKKKSQKAPDREIQLALKRMKEILED